MKKWKKVLLILFVLGLITGGYVFYIATKKPPTAADSKPIKEMVAVGLFKELDSAYKQVDSCYKDKNIGVSGTIKEIDSASMHIFIDAGEACSINCSFNSTEFSKIKASLKVGNAIKIKGIYSGCDGCDKSASDDGMDMLSSDKIAQLKTCSLNN
jgi:hypothetical protein